MSEFICQVDTEDKIVFLNDDWWRFAIENGLFLTKEKLHGNSVLNFISDLTSRHLYRIFMETVRRTGREVAVPFRCDSPDRRRFMRMTIRALPAKGIEFSSEILREELRPKIDLLDPQLPRSKDCVVMCSWCKKIKAPDWLEPEEAVARLNLFETERLPSVSHGICSACEKMFEQQFNG